MEQDLAAPEPPRPHLPGESDEVVLAQPGEQRTAGERRDDGVPVDHAVFHRAHPTHAENTPARVRSRRTCRLADMATVAARLTLGPRSATIGP